MISTQDKQEFYKELRWFCKTAVTMYVKQLMRRNVFELFKYGTFRFANNKRYRGMNCTVDFIGIYTDLYFNYLVDEIFENNFKKKKVKYYETGRANLLGMNLSHSTILFPWMYLTTELKKDNSYLRPFSEALNNVLDDFKIAKIVIGSKVTTIAKYFDEKINQVYKKGGYFDDYDDEDSKREIGGQKLF